SFVDNFAPYRDSFYPCNSGHAERKGSSAAVLRNRELAQRLHDSVTARLVEAVRATGDRAAAAQLAPPELVIAGHRHGACHKRSSAMRPHHRREIQWRPTEGRTAAVLALSMT